MSSYCICYSMQDVAGHHASPHMGRLTYCKFSTKIYFHIAWSCVSTGVACLSTLFLSYTQVGCWHKYCSCHTTCSRSTQSYEDIPHSYMHVADLKYSLYVPNVHVCTVCIAVLLFPVATNLCLPQVQMCLLEEGRSASVGDHVWCTSLPPTAENIRQHTHFE